MNQGAAGHPAYITIQKASLPQTCRHVATVVTAVLRWYLPIMRTKLVEESSRVTPLARAHALVLVSEKCGMRDSDVSLTLYPSTAAPPAVEARGYLFPALDGGLSQQIFEVGFSRTSGLELSCLPLCSKIRF